MSFPTGLICILKKNKAKGVAINGLPIRKASELFGVVNLVFFSPEDLNIIKNGPGERRRFLDLELCQLDKIYLTDLASYNHIVNQRNKLLKDLSVQPHLKIHWISGIYRWLNMDGRLLTSAVNLLKN